MSFKSLLSRTPKPCKHCGHPNAGEHELYCKKVVELAYSRLPAGSHLTMDDMALALYAAHYVEATPAS